MPNTTITKATPEDLPAVRRFSELLFGIPEGVSEPGQTDAASAISEGCVLIAKDGGQPIGYINWEYFGADQKHFPNSIFLSELWVEPPHRGKGLGRRLIQAALDTEHPDTYKYFSLTHDPAETHLTRLYESFGFRVTGQTEAGNVMMTKNRD
jgi:predicted N-acetyltransferase YhbS